MSITLLFPIAHWLTDCPEQAPIPRPPPRLKSRMKPHEARTKRAFFPTDGFNYISYSTHPLSELFAWLSTVSVSTPSVNGCTIVLSCPFCSYDNNRGETLARRAHTEYAAIVVLRSAAILNVTRGALRVTQENQYNLVTVWNCGKFDQSKDFGYEQVRAGTRSVFDIALHKVGKFCIMLSKSLHCFVSRF